MIGVPEHTPATQNGLPWQRSARVQLMPSSTGGLVQRDVAALHTGRPWQPSGAGPGHGVLVVQHGWPAAPHGAHVAPAQTLPTAHEPEGAQQT